MSNLMHQLQAWADEGRYDFENKTFNSEGIDFKSPSLIFPFSKNYSLDKLYPLVLDGVIPVWRPVEHYKPKDDEPVFLYAPSVCKDGLIGYYRSDDGEFHEEAGHRNVMTLIFPTHWMPLTQPPKEGN